MKGKRCWCLTNLGFEFRMFNLNRVTKNQQTCKWATANHRPLPATSLVWHTHYFLCILLILFLHRVFFVYLFLNFKLDLKKKMRPTVHQFLLNNEYEIKTSYGFLQPRDDTRGKYAFTSIVIRKCSNLDQFNQYTLSANDRPELSQYRFCWKMSIFNKFRLNNLASVSTFLVSKSCFFYILYRA